MQIYKDKCFLEPIEIISAFNNKQVKEAFAKIEDFKKQKKYLLGYVRYETKDVFIDNPIESGFPLVYFEVYDSYSDYETFSPQNPVNIYSEPMISYHSYQKALTKIKNHISEGNTYEVNYTYPYKVYSNAESITLYNQIIQKQKTDYNCFFVNQYEELLSFSPEMFFKIKGNRITTRPMKGTIERGITEEEDNNNKHFLETDSKNRAENVMIVDLLRNDLSRIAETGTVKTEKLFEIEEHPTLFQMTSKISAKLKDNTTLFEIFEAIFPCGSITGAPKISTMNIIEELEYYPRDVYCGAIGFISPEETVFSVPIRLLQKKYNESFYKYFVGGAIVWDSDIADEWDETLIKKKIIDSDIDYQLFETLLIENGEINLYDYHKYRILNSAEKLGFNFNEKTFKFKTDKDCIARFLLNKDGSYNIEYSDIYPPASNKIKISKFTTSSKNKFMYYKTTFRPWYKLQLKNLFDVIFTNENGELTEGTRSNLVLKIDGKYYTPELSAGILNGTYRQYLVDTNKIIPKVLYPKDLKKASEIYCINSVRRMVKVEL